MRRRDRRKRSARHPEKDRDARRSTRAASLEVSDGESVLLIPRLRAGKKLMSR
ncbi:hypothetical protein BDZ45DRAFT_681826 [Acephala macrosclerotiorum]|nr:hypothetical protein BDZ45DRAFT_681826 [Acephala macrosclerotiorum]